MIDSGCAIVLIRVHNHASLAGCHPTRFGSAWYYIIHHPLLCCADARIVQIGICVMSTCAVHAMGQKCLLQPRDSVPGMTVQSTMASCKCSMQQYCVRKRGVNQTASAGRPARARKTDLQRCSVTNFLSFMAVLQRSDLGQRAVATIAHCIQSMSIRQQLHGEVLRTSRIHTCELWSSDIARCTRLMEGRASRRLHSSMDRQPMVNRHRKRE